MSQFRLLRHRSGKSDGGAATTPSMPPLKRYVVDGALVPNIEHSSFADDLRFSEESPEHLSMALVPEPTSALLNEIADAWELHPTAREDLLHGVPRPKIDRYGDTLFIAMRSAWYVDAEERVDFAEFHVLIRDRAIVVICHDSVWIDGKPAEQVDDALAARFHSRDQHPLFGDQQLLRLGAGAVLYRLLDAVVNGYAPVLHGLSNDHEEIERQVFTGDTAVTERIYRLSQEVIDLQHATAALRDVLTRLASGIGPEGRLESLREYLRDVRDNLENAHLRVTEARASLSQILQVNAALIAQRQNEDLKKISGWAAVIFAPSLVGAVYGMNFVAMPELDWAFGYPAALVLMVAFALVLFTIFKVRKWM